MRIRNGVAAVFGILAFLVPPVLASDIPIGEYSEPRLAPLPEIEGATTPLTPDTYGTEDWIQLNILAAGYRPLSDGEWGCQFTGRCYRNAGSNSAACSYVTFPSGALVNGVTIWLYDNSATGRMEVDFDEVDWLSDSYNNLFQYETVAAETPGWVKQFYVLPSGNHTVDNDRRGYRTCVYQWTETDSTLGHYGISFWYKLQISPAPAVASFPDVGTGFWAFQEIEALAAAGITQGFPDGTFRPTDPVTRAQMATFLARALGLHWPDL